MSSSTDTLEAVLRTAVTYLAIIVSNVLFAARYFYANYPEASRIISLLVAGYFVFTSFMRIMRFWWGMVKFIVKATLLFFVVVVATCAYFRGPHRFFTKDLPFVYSLWQSFSQKQQESIQDSFKYALGSTGFDPVVIKEEAAGWLSDNAGQIDYLKNGAKQFAADNYDNIQNLMGNGNLQNIMNMGFGIH